jgi:DNA invertase Pin-like site-specific DNA recombinase
MTKASGKTCCLYLRVSTDEQTCQNQRLQLESFAASQGWTIVKVFEDSATGSNGDRPGFKAMFDAASRHEFDVVLVWSVDRITREGALKLLQYIDKLSQWNVGLRSYQESAIDTVGPLRDIFIAMYSTFAKLERDKLIDRTRAGLQRARAEGKQLGRPKLVVDRERIADMRAQGLTVRQVAGELGCSVGFVHKTYRQWKPCNGARKAAGSAS